MSIGSSRSAPELSTPDDDEDRLQRALAGFNHERLVPRLPGTNWEEELATEHEHKLLEVQYVERERARVRALASEAPREPDEFVTWFESLAEWGPGQQDRLFPWLQESATRDQMRWFLRQEMAGEAGFDDLVAMTQVRVPYGPKLELARNYWDELGQGHAGGMHSPLLNKLAEELVIAGPDDNRDVVWEALALGNLMVALAANRRYTYQSIGALGVIELTAPGRAELVNAGLKRLGVDGAARRYFALHATLDKKHSRDWNREVLGPLVAADPRIAAAIAEGALMRLTAGFRCFERYRALFGFAPLTH